MIVVWLGIALLAGALVSVQLGVNTQLRGYLGDPVYAALVSFLVGTLALTGYILVRRLPWPDLHSAVQGPGWIWIGGVLGAFFVLISVLLAPRLGAAVFLGLTILGQLVASLLMDHYGLLGFEQQPMNLWRGVGAVLLIVGVVLIRSH